MKNTVYVYPSMIRGGYSVRDYTAINYGGLVDIFKQYPSYFEYITVGDDEKIETIAYRIYGSADYADILLAINSEVFLWSMPYNNDIIMDIQDNYANILSNELGISSEINAEEFQQVLEYVNEEVDLTNSQKRVFLVPKISKMSSIISLISAYRDDNLVAEET